MADKYETVIPGVKKHEENITLSIKEELFYNLGRAHLK